MPELHGDEQVRQAEKESAAIIGFTSAIAAYGAFFIPKGLRHVDRSDRRSISGVVGLPDLLRHLRAADLVGLHPSAAVCFMTSNEGGAPNADTGRPHHRAMKGERLHEPLARSAELLLEKEHRRHSPAVTAS